MKTRGRNARRYGLFALLVAGVVSSCQLLVDSETGAGIGAFCRTDDDCQGASCMDQVCTKMCAAAADCPAPSECVSGFCELPTSSATGGGQGGAGGQGTAGQGGVGGQGMGGQGGAGGQGTGGQAGQGGAGGPGGGGSGGNGPGGSGQGGGNGGSGG